MLFFKKIVRQHDSIRRATKTMQITTCHRRAGSSGLHRDGAGFDDRSYPPARAEKAAAVGVFDAAIESGGIRLQRAS